MIAVDLPGHGHSDDAVKKSVQDTYAINAFARLIIEFCQRLKIEVSALAGWSLGVHIAIEAAAQAPDFFRGPVIFGAPPVGSGLVGMENEFYISEHMALTGKLESSEEDAINYGAATYGHKDLFNGARLAKLHRTDGRARSNMLSNWGNSLNGHSARQLVETWNRPICIIHGDDDVFVSMDYLESLSWANLWQQKIQTIQSCGHASFIQQPKVFNLYGSNSP